MERGKKISLKKTEEKIKLRLTSIFQSLKLTQVSHTSFYIAVIIRGTALHVTGFERLLPSVLEFISIYKPALQKNNLVLLLVMVKPLKQFIFIHFWNCIIIYFKLFFDTVALAIWRTNKQTKKKHKSYVSKQTSKTIKDLEKLKFIILLRTWGILYYSEWIF